MGFYVIVAVIGIFKGILVVERSAKAGADSQVFQDIHFREYIPYDIPDIVPVMARPLKVGYRVMPVAQFRSVESSAIMALDIIDRDNRLLAIGIGYRIAFILVAGAQGRVLFVEHIRILTHPDIVLHIELGIHTGRIAFYE